MPKTTYSVAYSGATLADFIAVFQPISDFLATAGWVKSADTGQVDWGTLAAVPASNVKTVYEIWKMGDALQATAPIFVKIVYGVSGTGPVIWLTVSNGSNGAGALTGTVSTEVACTPLTTTVEASLHPCFLRADAASFILALFQDIENRSYLITIERTKDAEGNDTDEGVIITHSKGGSYSSWTHYVYKPGGGSGPKLSAWIIPLPADGSVTTGGAGTDLGVGAPLPWAGGPKNIGLNLLLGYRGDFPDGTISDVVMYGANHQYRALYYSNSALNVPNIMFLIRWED
jgi:hypothetical protein